MTINGKPVCELCKGAGGISLHPDDEGNWTTPVIRCPECLAREKDAKIAMIVSVASVAAQGYGNDLAAKELENAKLREALYSLTQPTGIDKAMHNALELLAETESNDGN